MFPGVDGFHWTAGHIIFVSVFFTVLTVIAITVLVAMKRAAAEVRAGLSESIGWQSDFHDLPARDRACRHDITGEAQNRTCPNAFDCRACKDHPKFKRAADAAADESCGLLYPSWRYYHRGHTWVEPLEDGTLTVGLDEIGNRLLGKPDVVELPPVGTQLSVNGTGWKMRKNGIDVRVLAPIDGEVVATGTPDDPWYLRVKPRTAPPDLRHLLRGAEVTAWVRRELDRLMRLATPAAAQTTMADGGVLIHDMIVSQPHVDWDRVTGELFLEP